MALSAERSFIEPAIRNFVHESLPDFPDQVAYEGHQDMVNRIEQDIVAKAEGMYLWVKLVLCLLQNVSSMAELRAVVTSVPKGLQDLYATIIESIRTQLEQRDQITAFRIMQCLCVSDSEKFLGVLRSYHGLHLYANEYWLQHLLAFRSVDELHVIRDSTLHASVARLVHRQTDLLQTTGRTTAPSHTNPNLEDEDPQLFVQNCLGFQEQLKTCKKRTGEEMDHLRQTTDPTLLSAINSRYEDIFHRVLKWDPSSHSEREALARFRQSQGVLTTEQTEEARGEQLFGGPPLVVPGRSYDRTTGLKRPKPAGHDILNGATPWDPIMPEL
ncbi:MAG: hypothetical protein LQ340_007585 [Diploschistes diacapsis]|nr:MAG: hypothetical protein LQ340_007585 [Diploschistes diacapsis]